LTSNDGNSWNTRGMLPVPVRGAQLVVFQQRLFLIGGRDDQGNNRDEVWSSPDGATGSWIIEGQLPLPRAYGSALVYQGELWYAGGGSGGAVGEVWSSADGAVWNTEMPLPSPRVYMAAAIHAGQMWFIGGSLNADDGVVDVWRSNSGGYSSEQGLPAPTASAQAVHWRDRLFVIGGGTRFNNQNAQAYDVVLELTGGGDWSIAGSLPFGRYYGAMVIFSP
jgi:N-acetylneuraminic acid mutarotase